jgi:phosphoenolpyruvate carboxylase
VQSALRYDYPLEQVKECVRFLNENLPNGEAVPVLEDEEAALRGLLGKCRRRYEYVVELLAPLVNGVAAYVPQRRARKLHIGLFGYSRCVAGVCLPRAITFSVALYSIGLPPEFVGCGVLEDLSDAELDLVLRHYVNVKYDLETVGGFVSWQNINMLLELHEKVSEKVGADAGRLKLALGKVLGDLQVVEEKLGVKLGPLSSNQKRHENFANNFLLSWLEGDDGEAGKAIVESAKLRNCLG